MRLASVRGLRAPGLLGMPGPVWTMALWQACSALVLVVSLLAPMSNASSVGPRAIALVYTVVMTGLLVMLRTRTPSWLIHVQVAFGVLVIWALIAMSVTPVGRVTTAVSLVVLALYVGAWMPLPIALSYVVVGNVGLLVLFVTAGDMTSPIVPWAVIAALSLGLVFTLSVMVRQLRELAHTDALTGLLNRTGLEEVIAERTAVRGGGLPRALVVIDIDGLKVVNDELGHGAGDEMIQRFARGLRSLLRAADVAVRSGGDEFLVLLMRTELSEATMMAERIVRTTSVECSFGVTSWEREEPFEAAWTRADRLMYAHKAERGRGRQLP